MKKLTPLFSLLLLALAQQPAKAQNDSKKKYEFEKTKSYSKSYALSASDKVNISNKFGAVDVHIWNKDEIKVDVAIKVSAEKEDWAASVLNDIQVEDSKDGNTASFKTLFTEDLDKKEGRKGADKRMNKYKNKNTRQTMEVNYTVNMPANNALALTNEFGGTTLPDYSGEVELTSRFGSLTAGVLKNIKRIDVEFGSTHISSIANADVSVKYSSAEFDKLVGNIKLNIEFCGSVKLNMDNSLTSLDLNTSYSTVNLKPLGDPSASYKIFTSFGSFKNTTAIKFEGESKDEDHGPSFDKNYEGKSGSGTIPVKASAKFGKLILGEASKEDMKDKSKSSTT